MEKKQQLPKVEKRFIRIDAQSEVLTIKEDVPEDKAPKRLAKIRDMFTYQKIKHFNQYPSAELKVKTWVLNPELPFAAQR